MGFKVQLSEQSEKLAKQTNTNKKDCIYGLSGDFGGATKLRPKAYSLKLQIVCM